MGFHGWLVLAAILLLANVPLSRAINYTFTAQSSTLNGWFSPSNWYTNQADNSLHVANTIPGPGDTATIIGTVNGVGNQITIANLILPGGANSAVVNGAFYIANLSMGPGTGFTGSAINVSTTMGVSGGANFSGVILTIELGAILEPNAGGSLTFTTSTIFNVGEIILPAGTALTGGTNLVNIGTIAGTGNSTITGTGVFDNQGIVLSQGGTLNVGPFGTWTNSTGSGRFKTTISNAMINFPSGLTIQTNATNIFSGPGLIIWPQGAMVGGLAQVGIVDTNGLLDAGNLEMDSSTTSNGVIHIVATSQLSSTINFVTGTIGPVLQGPTLNIDFNGLANLVGGLIAQGSIINNSGTITWIKGGFDLPGSVLNNAGLFDCRITNSSTDGNLGAFGYFGGVINNSGTFRKSLGTNGVVVNSSTPIFNNSGLVDVRSGYIQISSGTNSGTFDMAPGAEIWFGGGSGTTNYLLSSIQFTGTNFARFTQFANIQVPGTVTIPNLVMQSSAVLDGAGNLIVSSNFVLNGGLIQGGGTFTLPQGTVMTVTNPAAYATVHQRTLNNSGTIIEGNNGGFLISTGGVLNNLATGTIQITTNSGISYDNSPPIGFLNNYGQITITNGGSGGGALYLTLTNFGTVQFQAGSFELYNFQQLAGLTTLASNASVTTGSTMPLAIHSGILTGSGKVNGPVSNYSVVIPGSPLGTMTISSYTETPTGALDIFIGGTNTNQFSQINDVGNPTLAGALNITLTNGFVPTVGQIFNIILGNYPRSGTFTTVTGAHLGNGIVLVPSYSYYNTALIAANELAISSILRIGKSVTFTYPSTSGLTNMVQYSDSLNPVVWKTLTNVMGDGSVKPIVDPSATNAERFYRVTF